MFVKKKNVFRRIEKIEIFSIRIHTRIYIDIREKEMHISMYYNRSWDSGTHISSRRV